MTKLKAATYHLLLSAFIISLVILIMFTLWYPGAYFNLMGGKSLIYLIGGVDIFIGPLLTFIVFKKNKKSLRFDLTCIGILQVTAMSYGLYVMFAARPVFTVFNIDTFQVVSPVDITPNELALGKKEEWRNFPITGPKLVAIAEPDKSNKWEWNFAKAASHSAARYPKLYGDYKSHKDQVIKVGKPLSALINFNPSNKQSVDKFITKQNKPITSYLYLPAVSIVNEMVAVVDARTGDFIEIIDAHPIEKRKI